MISLEPNEEILLVARKHWIIFLGEMLFIVLAALAPLFLYIFLGDRIGALLGPVLAPLISFDGDIRGFLLFFYALWLVALWHVLAYIWTDFYLDVWVVTNQRLIDMEQLGFFNRRISGFRHDTIQDVTVEVPGILATLLKHGTISVRTAGKDTAFSFPGVSHPYKLKELIVSEHNRAKDKGTSATPLL